MLSSKYLLGNRSVVPYNVNLVVQTPSKISTAASEKGVLIEDILRIADWSTNLTFHKFYYRSTQANNYAQALLQPRREPVQKVRVEPEPPTCCQTLLKICDTVIHYGLSTFL